MKPLLKTPYCNLPLSIPEPWRDFFDRHASTLGISRNAAMCLALKLGGPVLEKFVVVMRAQLKHQCDTLEVSAGRPADVLKLLAAAAGNSENVAPPGDPAPPAMSLGHERRQNRRKRR